MCIRDRGYALIKGALAIGLASEGQDHADSEKNRDERGATRGDQGQRNTEHRQQAQHNGDVHELSLIHI